MKYQVIVGNIGNVRETSDLREAVKCFREYVSQSKSGIGRAANEPVHIFSDNEIVKEYDPKFSNFRITINEIASCLRSLKPTISDEFRATDDPDDNTPAIQVTFGTNDGSDWSYQTGDNSFTGGAYGFRHWAVVYLNRRSNCRELAKDVISEWKDLMAQ